MAKYFTREETHQVSVGGVLIGGGAPVVVQTMTDTHTADAVATAEQSLNLVRAGAELVRITVNSAEAARAVPEIRQRLDDAGCHVPLVGDFHYNGHVLLADHPDCARALAKYRINPGNVGGARRRDSNFTAICAIARDNGVPVRIGVNGGSLDSELVESAIRESSERELGRSSREVLGECMVASALQSTELALEAGLTEEQIVISCKVSEPNDLVSIHRELAHRIRQPLHLGLTEAGMGIKGLVWSSAALAVLLAEGIGDTIRISLTPRPGGDRCEEVRACCELLQALGLRSFFPTITSCPGCGRTTSTTFQELTERVEAHVRRRLPEWRRRRRGVENLKLAVMGCIVNGPGESRAANVGISLPGTGESPRCPVFVDGELDSTIEGDIDTLEAGFLEIVEEYVETRLPGRSTDS